jgi:hypothetical protein
MWKCPNCGREFEIMEQHHFCTEPPKITNPRQKGFYTKSRYVGVNKEADNTVFIHEVFYRYFPVYGKIDNKQILSGETLITWRSPLAYFFTLEQKPGSYYERLSADDRRSVFNTLSDFARGENGDIPIIVENNLLLNLSVLANFMPLLSNRLSINASRAQYGMYDFFDKFLDCLKYFYINGADISFENELNSDQRSYVEVVLHEDKNSDYLHLFGYGDAGLNAFVKENYLEPFFEDFDIDSGNDFIPSEHKIIKLSARVGNNPQEDFKSFVTKSMTIINKRAAWLAKKIE